MTQIGPPDLPPPYDNEAIARVRLGTWKMDLDVPLHVLLAVFVDNYETYEVFALHAMAESGDRYIEAGSGIGFVTTMLARKVEHITSFEALPEMAALARSNLALAQCENAEVVEAALGPISGTACFHRRVLPYASSLLGLDLCKDDIRDDLEVPVVGLEEAMAKYGANALQIDVEGAEADLLMPCDLSPIQKITLEMHPHVMGIDRTQGLLLHLRDVGFCPVMIAGRRHYPDQCYVVGLARSPAADRLRQGPLMGDAAPLTFDTKGTKPMSAWTGFAKARSESERMPPHDTDKV